MKQPKTQEEMNIDAQLKQQELALKQQELEQKRIDSETQRMLAIEEMKLRVYELKMKASENDDEALAMGEEGLEVQPTEKAIREAQEQEQKIAMQMATLQMMNEVKGAIDGLTSQIAQPKNVVYDDNKMIIGVQ